MGAPLHAPLERLGVLPRQPQDVVEQPGCEVDAEGHCTRGRGRVGRQGVPVEQAAQTRIVHLTRRC